MFPLPTKDVISCSEIPCRVNRIHISIDTVVSSIHIFYDNVRSVYIEIYSTYPKKLNIKQPTYRGEPRLNLKFLDGTLAYIYTIAKPLYDKLDLYHIVAIPNKDGSLFIHSGSHQPRNILYKNVFDSFFTRSTLDTRDIRNHYLIMKLYSQMSKSQIDDETNPNLDKCWDLTDIGAKTIKEALNQYSNLFIGNKKRIPNVMHYDETIPYVKGNLNNVVTLNDISFPKSKPKPLSFSKKYNLITDTYTEITLRIEKLPPIDRPFTDPDMNTISIIFSVPESKRSITYDLLSGRTDVENATISKLLPGLVCQFINKAFLTGNYIYLNTSIEEPRMMGETTIFDMTYKNNSFNKKPNYSMPHNIVNVLSQIISGGNSKDQKHVISVYRYYVMLYMSLYFMNKRKLTSIKNVKEVLGDYNIKTF